MGLSLLEEQGGNPCLAGNVHDVSGDESRAKMGRLWSSSWTSIAIAIVIDQPNCRFWWSLIRESECAASEEDI
jgi:hypothetical protein